MRTLFLAIALCLAAACCSGCTNDGDVVPVAGHVLVDGEPLTVGNIRFVPKVGGPASSVIGEDGRFQLVAERIGAPNTPGVLRGKYQVQVSASRIVDDQTIEWIVPQRYADFRTSGIEITIDKPANDLIVRLSGKSDSTIDSGDSRTTARRNRHTGHAEGGRMNLHVRALPCLQSALPLRSILGAAIAVTIVVEIGCGDGRPTRLPVSGRVLIDGVPLTKGNIKFVPANGRPSVGKIGEDGRFTLTCYEGDDGALLGKHRVQVASNRIIGDSKIEWYAPPSYADFRTSGLEVEITKPTDDLKIELSWGSRKGPYIAGR